MISYITSNTLKNKTVLLRLDLNVPMDEKTGRVADAFRIEQSCPTIRMLLEGGNRIIICAHLGRPEGWDKALSLKPAAEKLAELLEYKFVATDGSLPDYPVRHVVFYDGDITDPAHRENLARVPAKDIVVLENIRFYPGEEQKETAFTKLLAGLADAYVNDAFSVDHHGSASVSEVPKLLPSYAGPLLEHEVKYMEKILKKPPKPFVLMMGGIKISDKVGVIENLGTAVDKILLGGGIANLFFAAKEMQIGHSVIEKDALHFAWQLSKNYKDKIVLPPDVVVADESRDKSTVRVCPPHEVRRNETMLDIGPKTILQYAGVLKNAKTIVWNGPMGLFETKPFDTGTVALARVIGGLGKRRAYSVVGGGETVDAVRSCHQFDHIDHVSTGGGAMLDFLAGKKLPGIEALT